VGNHDSFLARISGQAEGYDQTFSSIASNRNTEKLTDVQHVPSQEFGGAAQWNHELKKQTLIGGVDVQEVMGASDEQLFSSKTAGLHFANNIAGGKQRSTGIFGEDIFRINNRWTVIAGARWDDWNNYDGNTVRISIPSGTAAGQFFPSRDETAFSPRLSVMRNLGNNSALWISGYRAFRAPTLNELYRSFRQGSANTENNPALRAERLTGAEAGVRTTLYQRFESRATAFWADIVNPVTNVTLSSTPTLITRERENLGRIRSLGGELDGILHVSNTMQLSAGYQFTHAYVENSTQALVGKRVPEVPHHQLTWEARYWNPSRIMLSLEGRYATSQFDDDLNTLVLGPYFVMDVFAGRQFHAGLVGYVAVENVLNDRYAVAIASPVQNLGPPILARIGVRYDFPSRR
jgi:outer membrane receptor protein involved in Fe transport